MEEYDLIAVVKQMFCDVDPNQGVMLFEVEAKSEQMSLLWRWCVIPLS